MTVASYGTRDLRGAVPTSQTGIQRAYRLAERVRARPFSRRGPLWGNQLLLPGREAHAERLGAGGVDVDGPFDAAAGGVEGDALGDQDAASAAELEVLALGRRRGAGGDVLAGQSELDSVAGAQDRVQAAPLQVGGVGRWLAIQVQIIGVKDHRSAANLAQALEERERRAS